MMYIYTATVSLRPQREGVIDFSDLRVVMDYPVRVRERFGGQIMQPLERRVVVTRPEATRLEIRPLPTAGRPAGFSGAIGEYDFEVRAQPRQASVGEPITLTMIVTDQTEGGGTLDATQAPRLEEIDALTSDFRVPAERLAGDLDRNRKIFRQSVRARSDEVEAVPPIPFVYFDPVAGSYVTVRSERVPLEIEAGSSVDLEAVVGGPGMDEEDETVARPEMQADVPVAGRPAVQRPARLTWAHWSGLAVPPMAFVFMGLLAGRRDSTSEREQRRRERSARRTARRMLSSGDEPAAQRAQRAATRYLMDRFHLPAGGATSSDVRRHLMARGVMPDRASRMADLLEACETAVYTGSGGGDGWDPVNQARGLIDELDREKTGAR
jgi:hypothetical protein